MAWILGWGVGVVLVAALVDRLLLWMERRGWIYYRHRKAAPGTLGSALLEMEAILQPARQHVVETRKAKVDQRARDADDKTPGSLLPHGNGPR